VGSAVDAAAAGELALVPLGAEALTGQAGLEVAALLQHVWNPPCLWNSADYIRWQFAMPGRRLRSRGVGAYAGAQMAGFVGVVPRGVRLGDWIDDLWVLSFLAVGPEARGKGLARRLVDELARELDGAPILLYTQPGSHAEGVLRAGLTAQGSIMRTIGSARTYGGMLAPLSAEAAELTIEPVGEHEAWQRAIGVRPASADRLEAWPTAAEFAHYLADARGRTFHAVRTADGRTVAAASAVSAELHTSTGIVRQPTIELLTLHEPDAHVLAAAVRQAPVPAAETGPVLAANLLGIDEALLRPAALRATRSQWAVHLCYRDGHPLAAATQTNLEIV
jgi:GNAT superfamily N-acetyltransferase